MAKIIAVCSSEKKGTVKQVIPEGILKEDYGMLNDAHASGEWHRQVSLLAIESINKMRAEGFPVNPGDFAENLTTEGIDLVHLPIGTRLTVGDQILLEVTQIGKECHSGCAIMKQVGKCIMPKEGIFTRVLTGGTVKAGYNISVVEKSSPRKTKVNSAAAKK
jgi:MOSC domain-containing protein YiiM